MTQQQVIIAMKSIQDKQISHQPLTAEEIKMQKFHFNYGLHNGAKQYLKSINK